jgi:hypothetical protein
LGAAIQRAFLAWLLTGCGSELATPDAAPDSGQTQDAGWAALTDWDRIPSIEQGRFRRFSSHDRNPTSANPLVDPGNKDFNNFTAVCGDRPTVSLQEADGVEPCDAGPGYVIAAADDGPGYVSRMFFGVGTLHGDEASIRDIDPNFADERIRIYVDDVSRPAYEGAIADWVFGRTAPFDDELTAWTSGAVVSYVPVSYRSKVRVVLDELRETSIYYYQVDLHSADATESFDAEVVSAKAAQRLESLARARDATGAEIWTAQHYRVSPGATEELLSRNGGGTVRHIELRIPGADAAALGDISLRAVWDTELATEPALDVPLSELFATAPSLASFETLPMSVRIDDTDAVLALRLPMPFAAGATMAIVNGGSDEHELFVQIEGSSGPPPVGFGRLHATRSRQSQPVSTNNRFVVADLRGTGTYAGTVFAFHGTRHPTSAVSDAFNFLEGDETITVDGNVVARGTGTEEFVNGGFYFLEGRFDFPFSTVVATEEEPGPNGEATGRARGVRWTLLGDAIAFRDSFHLEFEYGANRPETMLSYTSVALYYLD